MSLTLFKTARDGMSLSIFGKKEKGQAMKNLFLACLMLLAGSAWAEWEYIAESDNSGEVVSFWVDPSTIKKNGNRRKIWGITAFMSPNKFGALSFRWQEEYDCKEEQARYLAFSSHSDHFAKGKTIHVDDSIPKDAPWIPVAPGTMQSGVMKFVCSK